MNSTPQFDPHPDAGILNAFAEQALGGAEREQILAHLALCNRCRQVVFLARQAALNAEEEITEARPARPSGKWYKSWSLAWIPAAALVAALVVTLYPGHTARLPELAKAVPPGEAIAPLPMPQGQTGTGEAPALPKSAISEKAAQRRAPAEEFAPEAAPYSTLPSEPGAIALSMQENQAAPPPSMESAQRVEPQETRARFNQEPAVAAWRQERRPMAAARPANAGAVQLSKQSALAAAGNARAGSSALFIQPQATKAAVPLAAGGIKLPSSLAAVSTANAGHRTLAIDLAGALFLSEDSGERWEPVVRQWTGHAVEVRVLPGFNGNTSPAGNFELKNDGGSIWVSADGRTWKAQ